MLKEKTYNKKQRRRGRTNRIYVTMPSREAKPIPKKFYCEKEEEKRKKKNMLKTSQATL